MGSTLILKVRIYLKSLHPFVHQEFPTFFIKTCLQKSPRLLFIRDCSKNQTVTQEDTRRNLQTEGPAQKNLQTEGPAQKNLQTEGSAQKNLQTEGSAQKNLQTEGAAQKNLQTEGSAQKNLQTEGSAQKNLQTEGSAQKNLQTEGAAQKNLQTEGSAQKNLQTEGAAQKNLQTEGSAQKNLQTEGAAQKNLQTEGAAQKNLQTEGSAQKNLQTEGSAQKNLQTEGAAQKNLQTEGAAQKNLQTEGAAQKNLQTEGPAQKNLQTEGSAQNKSIKLLHQEFLDDARRKDGPSCPRSVFAAGTAKRTAERMKRRASPVSEEVDQREEGREDEIKKGAAARRRPDRPLAPAEWRRLREALGAAPSFEVRMMRTLFLSEAELPIAKSLLTFVAMETGTLPYQLLLGYLMLCVRGGHHAEVFDVYSIMRGSFPSLDTGASSLFIKSFSQTSRWTEAVGIIHEVKKVFTPSSRNYGDVIAAAMLNGDTATAWALYDELIEMGLTPHQETWGALFTRVQKSAEEEGEEVQRLLRILLYMRNNQIYPQRSVAIKIKTWFESLTGQKWTGHWTSASPKGVCQCCGSELESIQLTDEEYQVLKDRVITDIILGRDVFHKTTPEEFELFETFVKSKPVFDVVIDGLNVANINKDKRGQSQMLLTVVSELACRGLSVLVLGRKHMLQPSRSWDGRNMQQIRLKAHCFFTDNISEDDPFLLYAALHSGNHCRFVSRDLMRDHKACLPDGATRRLFFKWQRGHQLVVEGLVASGRRIRFQSVPSYDTIVQTRGDFWHIPYDDQEDRSSYEVPQRWLCLKKH